MYNIIYEISRQSRFDAQYWMLGAGALGWPRGMVWGGRREKGSGWGTRICLWLIHFDVWQNQYNIVKFKNKIKNCLGVKIRLKIWNLNVWDLCGRNIFYITMNVFKIIFLKVEIWELALILSLMVNMVIKLWSEYIISLEVSSFYVTWKRKTMALNFLLTLKCYGQGFLENKTPK